MPNEGDEYLGFICEPSLLSQSIVCDSCGQSIHLAKLAWWDKITDGDVLCVVCMSVVMKFNARFGIPGPRP